MVDYIKTNSKNNRYKFSFISIKNIIFQYNE